jgi:hypothetical protein
MDTAMARTRSNVADPPEQAPPAIADFISELERQEISPLTRESYHYDLEAIQQIGAGVNGSERSGSGTLRSSSLLVGC